MKLHISLIPLSYFLKILGDYTETFTDYFLSYKIINTENFKAHEKLSAPTLAHFNIIIVFY